MDLFFKDSKSNLEVNWDQLLSDLQSAAQYNPYCRETTCYEVFRHLITSLILGEKIVLIDFDFCENELIRLIKIPEFTRFVRPIRNHIKQKIKTKQELIQLIKSPKDSWSISLFTSGTTGLPKKVTHSYKTITRSVKISEQNSTNIWGYCFDPTHMAGLQVFFQAILNGNPLIRLSGLSNEYIFNEIIGQKITNISATPTFYRLLLSSDVVCHSVTHVTSGGEKVDEKTLGKLKMIFPRAKFTNIYASTEAGSLLASEGTIFAIKPIEEQQFKIENGELLIHKMLMGDLATPTDDWYHTGDLVEIISEDPIKFRFVSRKNEMINVGGNKVNPNEVEDLLRNMPGIKDVHVFSKVQSILGQVIYCDAVKSDTQIDETNVRLYLQSRLQEFKIPRIIRFVDKILTTHTGKIKRSNQ